MAFCLPLTGSGFLPQAKAQSEAFPLGVAWADMLDPAASLDVFTLPHPGLPNYDGTAATRSQMVRTDGDGCVLFFGKDGVLYDHDGYLMGSAFPGVCEQCLPPGVMEMVSVPVPGYCNLYYIFTAQGNEEEVLSCNPDFPTKLAVAILDLAADNPLYPGRKGALVEHYYGEPLPGVFLAMDGALNDYAGWLDHSRKACTNSPMIRVIDPTGSGQLFFLYFIGRAAVVEYRIDAAGISLVTAGMDQVDFQPTMETWGAFVDKPYYRDAAISRTNGNEIRLAMTDDHLQGYDVGTDDYSTGHGPVLILRYNGTTGALLGTEEIPFGTGGLPDFGSDLGTPPPAPGVGLTGGPGGIAWLDAGNTLLIQGEARVGNQWEYRVGTFDLINDDWTDLTATLNVQDPEDFMYARLSTSRMNVNSPAYYLPHAGGLARIEDPMGSPVWNPAVALSTGVTPPAYAGYAGDPYFHPRFLNAQVSRDDAHLAAYQNPGCCDMWLDYLSYPGYNFGTEPATLHWYPYDNPFGNCGEVNFSADLVVPPWINLHIHDMTLKFGLDARLILQAGAYVKAEQSNFLPVDCEVRWPGIRVEGNPANLTQNEAEQGSLWLNDCLVEEAHVGVWCAREGQPGHYGGIVRSYNSTFMDCIVGARIERYHRIIGSNEYPNKCTFANTDFRTTLGWPDPQVNSPDKHVWLYHVNGVSFNNCSFVNEAVFLWTSVFQRGRGIHALRATFRCNGYQNYTENRFSNLYYGVFVSNPHPAWAYRMEGMAFNNNFRGIHDQRSVNAVITNNKFTTLALNADYDDSSVGLYLYQSRGYTVERNQFYDGDTEFPEVPSVGVWFRGPATMDNRIYDNDFYNLNAGNVVQGDHEGSAGGQPPSITGLQMLCNDYTDCSIDQFIMVDGHIRLRQGEENSVLVTANNRFFKVAPALDCTTTFEPYVDPLRDVNLPNIRYYYFAGSVPELRPECVEQIDLGQDETWIGSHYDLLGTEEPNNDPFDPAAHCNGGILDIGSGHVSDHLAAYSAKVAEYQSALEAYHGQVDNGDKDTPLEAIAADPAWPSHQLRDLLILNSPLSDTVMRMAIRRDVPMDAWHLTQVLIGNSRISEVIWRELDDTNVFAPFFYNLLVANQTNPSLRSVLEDEVALRSAEKSHLLQRIQLSLDDDSTYVGKVDTLMNAYLADSMGTGLELGYCLAVAHERYTEAAQIKARFPLRQDVEVLTGLGDMQESLNGDWTAATPAQRDLLWEWAFTRDRTASADAWSLLLLLGETDSLPPALLPPAYRGAIAGHTRGTYVAEPTLAAYPNPASDRVMITLPTGMSHTNLEVLDVTGKLVRSSLLAGEVPFVELDIRDLPTGLYLARLTFEGFAAGDCKFTVTR